MKSDCELEPLDNYIVVSQSEPETKSRGGIVLPDQAQEKTADGNVLAVGPGMMLNSGSRVPCMVKVGDHIAYDRYAPREIKVGQKTFKVIRETDIYARLNT